MTTSEQEYEPVFPFDITTLPLKALAKLCLFMHEHDDLGEYFEGSAEDFSLIQQNVMRAILHHTWGLELSYHQNHLILQIKASCIRRRSA